jgi:hypothetical protein
LSHLNHLPIGPSLSSPQKIRHFVDALAGTPAEEVAQKVAAAFSRAQMVVRDEHATAAFGWHGVGENTVHSPEENTVESLWTK